MPKSNITVDRREMAAFRKEIKRMMESLDHETMAGIHERHLQGMVLDMQVNAPSDRFVPVIDVDTKVKRRPYVPYRGARIGVLKNRKRLFPDFSAPALASVLEYGTGERFRGGVFNLASTGKVTDRRSWLRRAWDRRVGMYMTGAERDIIRRVEHGR